VPLLMTLAWVVFAPAVGGAVPPARASSHGELRLVFQSLVPPGASEWRLQDVDTLASTASDWLQAASGGRMSVREVRIVEAEMVPSSTCRDLARAVAVAHSTRAGDLGAHRIYLGQADDCPYLGLAEMNGSWIVIASPRAGVTSAARTVVHELGHTLGLAHAGAERCPVLLDAPVPSGTDCDIDEYGDLTDPLGRGSLAWGLNPVTLQRLGWGDTMIRVEGDGRHVRTLAPVAAAGPDGLRVTDPINGDHYVVSNRAAGHSGGLDRKLTDGEQGVYLHRLPRPHEVGVGSVLLPWVASISRAHGGKAGYFYLAVGGGLSIRVLSVSGGQAIVEVRLSRSGGLTDDVGPTFNGGGPSINRTGKTTMVSVPRAWDQSGISNYAVVVGRNVVWRSAGLRGLASHNVRLSTREVSQRGVVVRVIDGKGNVTSVRLT